jgi:hypothetical protein
MNIGLLRLGDKNWIAGVIYLHNLIKSINYVNSNEKINIRLFIKNNYDLKWHIDELGNTCPPIHIFNTSKNIPLIRKTYHSFDAFKRFIKPVYIENLFDQFETDVVFPANAILSKKKRNVKHVSWIPDFQHLIYPEFFSNKDLEKRTYAFEMAINESDHLILSSQNSFSHLKTHFKYDPEKISILPFASVPNPEWFDADPEEVRKEFKLPLNFLYYPSQFWIHKNHTILFKAISIIKENFDQNFTLVCTGNTFDHRNPNYFKILLKEIDKFGMSENIRILGLLPRIKQVQLIRASTAVVQPSLFEGWSSVVEDARLFKKPAILSNIDIHREQNPENSIFFSPSDPDELASIIIENWTNFIYSAKYNDASLFHPDTHEYIKKFAVKFISILQKVVYTDN